MRTQHIARVLLLSTIVFFLTGCQVFSPVGDFIGQRYTNTASYFNTYYNAQKMFGEAESEVLMTLNAAREKSARGQTTAFVLSSTARQKFTNSIEKNSKLLSYYPTSKYVDDALLMIGKAYYYLEEDVKAERKFLELISQYSESDLVFETKLWYGKSLLRQKRNAEGLQLLATLYTDALEDGDDDAAGLAALAVAAYYFEENDYDNALKYYAQSVDALSDDEENARTQFQIGICYSKMDRPSEAREAFRAVTDYSPDYNTAFQAAVYESRMLTREQKYDAALELLFEKIDDSKFSEFYGTAHREVGNTYAAQGNIDEAVAQYRYVDTAFARTDDAARSMFALATLYEFTLIQYDSARTYYDKAKVEFSSSEITPDATRKSEIFGKYFSLKRDLANYDTLITDILFPRPVKLDSALAARRDSVHRADSLARAERGESALERMARMRTDTSSAPADTAAAGAGVLTALQNAADSLKLAPPAELTQAMKDSVASADSLVLAAKRVEKNKLLDSLALQVTRTKFELAGLLYLELNRPDSALVYFTEVVRHTTDSSLAARSYFTMAEIHASSDSSSRTTIDSIYRRIIAIAPQSSYAQEARKNLGIPLLAEATDSAEVHFWAAERAMDTGKPQEAIPLMRSLAAKFPKSPYSSKALFAVGWIFENSLFANDSAEAAYNQLKEKFPASKYTKEVQPKLSEIATMRREAEDKAKAEREANAKAEAEKKAALEKAEADKKEAAEKAKVDAAKLNIPKSGKQPLPDSSGVRTRTVPAALDSAGAPMHVLPAASDSAAVQPTADSTAVRMKWRPKQGVPAADTTSRME